MSSVIPTIKKEMKSLFATPLTRFLKNSIRDPKNIPDHRKRYLFDKSYGKKAVISYVPDAFNIGITFRCNFRCPPCTFLLRDKQAFDGKDDMSLEQFNWILEKYKNDIGVLGLTGGEPTLHPQFSEIVKSAKKRNLKLVMPTNGTQIIKRIDDLKYFDKINVSLDGINYEQFKKTRSGTEEQYNDIIAGIHLLRDSKIPFQISFLLFEETLPDIKKILDFARELKPSLLKFESGNPHDSKSLTPLLVNSPAVRNFLKEILQNDDYPFSIRMPVIFDPSSKLFQQQPCPQLWQTIIGPTGDIAYCCHLQYKPEIGNIFKGYNFNSPLVVKFRKAMIEHKFPVDCLYCKNRFFELSSLFFENFSCLFNSKEGKWIISPSYQEILKKNETIP